MCLSPHGERLPLQARLATPPLVTHAPRSIIMVSFGGLLMRLAGPREHLAPIELNATVYALFRKTKGTSA